MVFNKRFLCKEHILKNEDRIMDYLDADAVLTTDQFSRDVYRLYNQGKPKEQIIQYIIENK